MKIMEVKNRTYKDTLVQNKWQPVKIETDTILLREELEKLKAVNDDDWVSFYKNIRKGSEVVLDYGKSVTISSLVYIPRNDDNYVRMGDTYELLYHDGQRGMEDTWLAKSCLFLADI